MLPRIARSCLYGSLGITLEVVFTGFKNLWIQGDVRLQGYTQIWVLPLYGLGALCAFETIHDRLRGQPALVRAAAYGLMVLGLEYAGGMTAWHLTGVLPWEYEGYWSIHRVINIPYWPLWGGVCLIGERVHDYFLSLERLPVASSK